MAVTGTEGTSHVVPATDDITIALFKSDKNNILQLGMNREKQQVGKPRERLAFSYLPIFVYDYEVTGTNVQTATNENVAYGNANPFPNVNDVELNAP
ncbi:hypothetical protein Tco_0070272 [Tanacetum coccineum]